MNMSPLKQFVLAAALWLPMAFFLWFVLAGPVIWPVARLLDFVLPLILPDAVSGVQMAASILEVETRLLTAAGAAGQQGVLVLEVEPLVYAWCLPLFAGLAMATPLEGSRRWLQFAIGLPVLWLVVSLGSLSRVLKILAFDAGPLGAAAISAAGFSVDAVALGYQFGYLILPAVSPVALWVVLNRRFLEELVGWTGEPEAPTQGPNAPADRPSTTDSKPD